MAASPVDVRRGGPPARWELASRPPAPPLAGDVLRYVGFVEVAARPLRRREVPAGTVVLILNLGVPLLLSRPADGTGRVERHGSFLAGLDDAYGVTEFAGTSEGVQVDLTPVGAHRLLGVPMHLVARRALPLDDLLGPAAARLAERVAAASTWAARFDLLDAELGARLAAAPPASPAVAHVWRRLAASHGRAPIVPLATEVGWSHRHLVARFHEEVGLPPKRAARVLRFARAARLLGDRRHALADVAATCGYADQAHLTRDVREFAGTTPRAFVARQEPDGFLGTADAEVSFVQDGGRRGP